MFCLVNFKQGKRFRYNKCRSFFPLSNNKYNLRNNMETEGFKYKHFFPLGVLQGIQHM